MQQGAYAIAFVAVAGAIVSWLSGAWFYVETLRVVSKQPGRPGLMLRALFGWMFAMRHLQGEAAEQAVKVNKAIVAFFVCMLVAVAAISVATNLARLTP